MKWYLSGAMSGYPGHNRAQFELNAKVLRGLGYDLSKWRTVPHTDTTLADNR